MTLLDHKNCTVVWGLKYLTKMSSVMPCTFNAVELCVVTLNDKSWTRAKDVCKALKYQINGVPFAVTTVDWLKD